MGYKVEIFDPKFKSFFNISKSKSDVIFNALHGEEGEDGFAQSFFEYSKIPYTHSGVIASMNAMNKLITKKYLLKIVLKHQLFFLSLIKKVLIFLKLKKLSKKVF